METSTSLILIALLSQGMTLKQVVSQVKIPVLRVIHGRDANANEHPYVVSLETKRPYKKHLYRLCTGSVITYQWVLTCAHCELEHLRIRYGDMRLPRNKSSFSNILEIIRHPNYKDAFFSHWLHTPNDIALVLADNIRVNSFAYLSAVDYKSIIGQEVTYAGYGHGLTVDEYDSSDEDKVIEKMRVRETMPLQMGEGVAHVIPQYFSRLPDPHAILYVASKCGEKAHQPSFGDEGGPLFYDTKIVGIFISSVLYQKEKHIPMVNEFIAISPYLNWISGVVYRDI